MVVVFKLDLQEDWYKGEELSCFCELFAIVELLPVSESTCFALIRRLKWCSLQVVEKNKHALQKSQKEKVKPSIIRNWQLVPWLENATRCLVINEKCIVDIYKLLHLMMSES